MGLVNAYFLSLPNPSLSCTSYKDMPFFNLLIFLQSFAPSFFRSIFDGTDCDVFATDFFFGVIRRSSGDVQPETKIASATEINMSLNIPPPLDLHFSTGKTV